MIKNIISYFRKHNFDFDNPIIIKGINHCIGLFGGSCDIPFSYKKLKCKKCGIEIRESYWKENKTKWNTIRKCKGKIK